VKPLDWLKGAFGRIVALAIVLPLSILFIKAIPYYLAIIEYLMTHTFIAILAGILVIGVLIGIWIFAKQKKQERYMMIQKFSEILKLNWREFEEFVEAILIDRGFDTILWVWTKDGWVDITAKFEWRTYLIQCKHYNDFKKVTVEQVREFYGVMNHIDSTAKWIYVTTGELTHDAYFFAEQEDIEVWDKFYFLDVLKEINVETKPKTQTEWTLWICEKCWGKMLLRTAHRWPNSWSQFLGCENYPKCTFTKGL
jgi:restriction system protein